MNGVAFNTETGAGSESNENRHLQRWPIAIFPDGPLRAARVVIELNPATATGLLRYLLKLGRTFRRMSVLRNVAHDDRKESSEYSAMRKSNQVA
jgi:hypothetical protein